MIKVRKKRRREEERRNVSVCVWFLNEGTEYFGAQEVDIFFYE
jgi:hypothetical protein